MIDRIEGDNYKVKYWLEKDRSFFKELSFCYKITSAHKNLEHRQVDPNGIIPNFIGHGIRDINKFLKAVFANKYVHQCVYFIYDDKVYEGKVIPNLAIISVLAKSTIDVEIYKRVFGRSFNVEEFLNHNIPCRDSIQFPIEECTYIQTLDSKVVIERLVSRPFHLR